MNKMQFLKLLIPLSLSLGTLTACENLPGTSGQQGAVIGGASGAVAGSALGGGTLGTVVGGALGAGTGYEVGKHRNKN